MDTRKILILGGDGMAGNMIKTFLQEKGWNVSVTTRKPDNDDNYFFDVLSDYKGLEKIIEEIKPNFVINCVGVLNQSAEENKAGAVLINSFLPHYVDSLSEKYAFKLIHISTDCVFSGEKGSYSETDFADATSFYGRTKSLGELNNDGNITFRTSIVGPDTNEKGVGLFNWFMKQEGETNGYRYVIWSGVTTLELAKAIEKSFDTNISGLYHLVNNEKIDKYALLTLFKEYMHKNIQINEDVISKSDKSIINNRTDFDFNIPSYEDMTKEMCEWIFNHEDKYQQIILNTKK